MAAFCGCCGAEIGPKAEACPVCGTPRHGMLSLDPAIQSDTGSKSDNPATMHLFSCEMRKETSRPKVS
jgi:predicted amidophosphoribosyltransferase